MSLKMESIRLGKEREEQSSFLPPEDEDSWWIEMTEETVKTIVRDKDGRPSLIQLTHMAMWVDWEKYRRANPMIVIVEIPFAELESIRWIPSCFFFDICLESERIQMRIAPENHDGLEMFDEFLKQVKTAVPHMAHKIGCPY